MNSKENTETVQGSGVPISVFVCGACHVLFSALPSEETCPVCHVVGEFQQWPKLKQFTPDPDLLAMMEEAKTVGKVLVSWPEKRRFTPEDLEKEWAEGRYRRHAVYWDLAYRNSMETAVQSPEPKQE